MKGQFESPTRFHRFMEKSILSLIGKSYMVRIESSIGLKMARDAKFQQVGQITIPHHYLLPSRTEEPPYQMIWSFSSPKC